MKQIFTSCFVLIVAFSASAQCTLSIDSVLSSAVSCNGLNDGEITVFASGGNGAISFSNTAGGEVVSPNQPFDAATALSNASGSGPTNRWWSPSSCTGGASFQFSATQGCPAGSATYTGPFSGFAGCFLRSPQLNMNGIDLVTATFDLSNSFAANRPNDRLRFYVWVNNGYLSVPAAYTVNGNSGQFLNFNQANTCAPITVTVNLSSVPSNSRSDFLFYIEANCQYNNCTPYLAVVDNIVISEAAPTQASNVFSGLPAGNYPITVSDASGCQVSLPAPVTITQPPVLTVSTTVFPATTVGGNQGSAIANVSGGNGAYTFAWNTNPPQNTAQASGLSAGTYSVTVADAEGCTQSTTALVTEPSCDGLSISSVTAQNPSCAEANDGSLTITAQSPNSGLSFTLNGVDFQSEPLFSSLSEGSYSAAIADAAGCSLAYAANPLVLVAPESPAVIINFDGNQLSVNGFTAVQWYLDGEAIQGANSAEWSPNADGIYTVQITDEEGCTYFSQGFEVLLTHALTNHQNPDWLIFPNPGREFIRLRRDDLSGNAQLRLWSVTGQQLAVQQLEGFESVIDVSLLKNGIYLVEYKDDNGVYRQYWIKQ
jgi:hypothetical protein